MLTELLTSRLRAGLVTVLFGHPSERYFVRQLAALVGQSSTNVSRELSRLEKLGLLMSATEGRNKYYTANPRCPIFPEIRGLVMKTAGLADVLRDALKLVQDRIRVAFVFGSVASGSQRPESDVDLMIVGNVSLTEIASPLRRAVETLGREVNPVIYTASEFAAAARARRHFVTDVLRGPRIYLMGDDSDTERISRQRLPRKA